jgi:hypothetical protein
MLEKDSKMGQGLVSENVKLFGYSFKLYLLFLLAKPKPSLSRQDNELLKDSLNHAYNSRSENKMGQSCLFQ